MVDKAEITCRCFPHSLCLVALNDCYRSGAGPICDEGIIWLSEPRTKTTTGILSMKSWLFKRDPS